MLGPRAAILAFILARTACCDRARPRRLRPPQQRAAPASLLLTDRAAAAGLPRRRAAPAPGAGRDGGQAPRNRGHISRCGSKGWQQVAQISRVHQLCARFSLPPWVPVEVFHCAPVLEWRAPEQEELVDDTARPANVQVAQRHGLTMCEFGGADGGDATIICECHHGSGLNSSPEIKDLVHHMHVGGNLSEHIVDEDLGKPLPKFSTLAKTIQWLKSEWVNNPAHQGYSFLGRHSGNAHADNCQSFSASVVSNLTGSAVPPYQDFVTSTVGRFVGVVGGVMRFSTGR